MRILIVDDEVDLLNQLQRLLEDQRYTITTAADGEVALDYLFGDAFDLVILDIMLPKFDGIHVLKELRRAKIKTPVLMLTARAAVPDRVEGLDSGADDYLAKPFSLDELLSRIRALLRRAGEQSDAKLTVGALELDTASREVSSDGVLVDLTAREFSILEFLLYNKNRAVSRLSLAEHVWGDAFDPFSMSNFLDVHIKNLRRKIGDSKEKNLIVTIHGVGYMIREH